MSSPVDADSTLGDVAWALDRDGTLPPAFETTLVETVRALTASVPAPRYDPFYGIDRAGGPSLAVLEELSRHGDFRKYVRVLDVRGGLGGAARWLTLRYGCRVVALDRRPSVVRLVNELSRRARLSDRVVGLTGEQHAIPVRDGLFTQIWSVEALQSRDDFAGVIRELFRVLRPGSPIALQEIVGGTGAARSAAAYVDALADAGFGTIDQEDVTDRRAETSPLVLSARASCARLLRERTAMSSSDGAVPLSLRDTRRASDPQRVVQIFARRPST